MGMVSAVSDYNSNRNTANTYSKVSSNDSSSKVNASTPKDSGSQTADTSAENIQIAEVTDPSVKTNYQNEMNGIQANEQKIVEENAKIRKAVGDLNKKMANNTEAIFGIHDGTNRVTIKIVDKDTKEVIREVPAEKTLDMIEKVWEMAGILVDEKR